MTIEIIVKGDKGSGKMHLASFIHSFLQSKNIDIEFEQEGIIKEDESNNIENLSGFLDVNQVKVHINVDLKENNGE